MKLLYFRSRGKLCLGVATDKGVIDIDDYQDWRGHTLFSPGTLTNSEIRELKEIVEKAARFPEFIREEGELVITP